MVPENTPLYRYVSFDRFSEMLYEKKLAVISPRKWPDGYENYWMKWLDSETGKQSLRDYLAEAGTDCDKVFDNVNEICRYLNDMTFCLCFSQAKDAEVLWNAHSDNNRCIMFATSEESVNTSIPELSCCPIKPINYDPNLGSDYSRFLSYIHIIDGKASLFDIDELFLQKRDCFTYENEARLIFRSDKPYENGIIKFDITDLSKLIDGVMVHPAAEDHIVSLVRLLCDQHGIPFWGKSKLYTFRV